VHVISFATRIGGDQPASAAVATAVLVFLFVVRARWPQMPGLLLAMRLASGAVAAGRPNDHGKAVAGQIPAGLLLALGLLAAFSDDVL
jgi:MFS superfamily sulfate permease-like transporter